MTVKLNYVQTLLVFIVVFLDLFQGTLSGKHIWGELEIVSLNLQFRIRTTNRADPQYHT